MDALRDAHSEGKKTFEPKLRSWLLTLSRVTVPAAERSAHTALLQRVTALRTRLLDGMKQASTLLDGRGSRRPSHDEHDAQGDRGTAVSGRASAAATTGEGNGCDASDEDDEFEAAEVDLKPGYEPRWVDPDEGWEKPPPEAMRSIPLQQQPSSRADPSDAATKAASTLSTSLGAMGTASAAHLDTTEGATTSVDETAGSLTCGARRRDGSCCQHLVPPGGLCQFHGKWVERDSLSGWPLHCAKDSVWARVLLIERECRAGRGAQVGGAAMEGGKPAAAAADDDGTPAPTTRRSAQSQGTGSPPPNVAGDVGAPSDGGDPTANHEGSSSRKRARNKASGSDLLSSAAHRAASSCGAPSSAAGATPCSGADSSASTTRGSCGKRPPTGRQRLSLMISKGAKRSADAFAAQSAHRDDLTSRNQQGW
jgi:hypothetical protein